jgi:hypothetical protein
MQCAFFLRVKGEVGGGVSRKRRGAVAQVVDKDASPRRVFYATACFSFFSLSLFVSLLRSSLFCLLYQPHVTCLGVHAHKLFAKKKEFVSFVVDGSAFLFCCCYLSLHHHAPINTKRMKERRTVATLTQPVEGDAPMCIIRHL